MGKVQTVSWNDINQQPVETERLIFLCSRGISLLTEGTILSCYSIQGELLAEEAEFVRVDAVVLNNDILICSSKVMKVDRRAM